MKAAAGYVSVVRGDHDVVQSERGAVGDATAIRIWTRVSVLNRQIGDHGVGVDVEDAINIVAVDDRGRGPRPVDRQLATVDRVVDVEVTRGRMILALPENGEGVGVGQEVDDVVSPQ